MGPTMTRQPYTKKPPNAPPAPPTIDASLGVGMVGGEGILRPYPTNSRIGRLPASTR